MCGRKRRNTGMADVHGVVKQVSKANAKIARRAITRGRWRPVKYLAEEGEAICAAASPYLQPSCAVPDAACATFRAAWAVDASLAM